MNKLQEEVSAYLNKAPISKSTENKYRKALNEFLEFMSKKIDEKINEIHLERIYVYFDGKGNYIGHRSIDAEVIDEYLISNTNSGYSWLSNNRNALGSFFKYLRRNYDFEYVIQHLKFKLKDYKPVKRPINILGRHGFLVLLHNIVTWSDQLKRDVLFFSILFSTGCRISELLNLKCKDVYRLNDSFFLESTKNKVQRMVIMRIGFGEVIKKYCDMYDLKDEDYIFHNKMKPMNRNEVQTLLNYYLDKGKLPNITVHAIRHTFATMMLESGAAITIIQQLLGHLNLNTTKTYIHPNYVRNYGVVIKENQEIYKRLKEI